MWSVLRRLQGEEYDADEVHAGVTANLNHIAHHSCRPNMKAIPPELLTEPYGRNVYPKLRRTMAGGDSALCQKALEGLLSLFEQKQEHVVQAVKYDLTEACVAQLAGPNNCSRALACGCLRHIVATQRGLERVLQNEYHSEILRTVNDEDPAVVVEALRCLSAMDHSVGASEGTQALIQAGSIPLYIAKAKSGPDTVAECALAALSKVFNVKEAFIKVLDEGMMPVLADLMKREHDGLLEQAAHVLARLAFYAAGKRASAKLEILSSVAPLCRSPSIPVRRAATAAAMTVTVSIEGKQQALDCGLIKDILDTIAREADDVVAINLLKVVCNCAENPAARQLLLPLVPVFEKLAASPNEADATQQTLLLARTAKRAVHVVQWQPGSPIVPV